MSPMFNMFTFCIVTFYMYIFSCMYQVSNTVKNVRDKERLSRDGIKNVIAKMSEVRSLICCIINVDYVIDNIL